MLKRLLSIAAVLPLIVTAQPARPRSINELAFHVGHAFDNASKTYGQPRVAGGYLRGALSLLRSNNRFQYGATVEGGTNSWDEWYLAPGAVANYRIPQCSGYWYGGVMAGYTCSGEMGGIRHDQKLAHGYVFGLQAGYARAVNKRLFLNGELAVRSSQSWHRYDEYVFNQPGQNTPTEVINVSEPRTVLYLPVTIGLRYRL